ncbi:hypothetical protein MPER_11322 [Moniliophthora perniciosa FA553]|nr:hypothetical protein MPER_11322 [Moniliophthora perniciosa FA553]
MRIGFLVKDDEEHMPSGAEEALGYGINVALTVDSAYVVGAAVTMRSAVEATPERITFYIVDCGLSSEEKNGLCKSVPARGDVTMVFLSLPGDGLAKELNTAVWAKLVFLRPLWEIDLEGKTLGAALDVGHPVGHGDLHGKPYFNAGVLLLDLAKDEAEFEVVERKMVEPNIVHFTGPVHPSLPEVLNPYVQPPTCKPWGYLEASGHPFRREWWQVLERTTWKGLRESSSWKEQRSKAIEHSVEEATKNFHSRVEKVCLVVDE